MDVTVGLGSNLCKAFEVLGIGRDNDVNVLCPSNDPPGIDCKAADQDEVNAPLGKSAKNLIEGWLGQSSRAVPTNRISW